jgi:hypothetical protein
MNYDFLVLATGPQLAIDRVPGFFENSHHLLGVNPQFVLVKQYGNSPAKTSLSGFVPEQSCR